MLFPYTNVVQVSDFISFGVCLGSEALRLLQHQSKQKPDRLVNLFIEFSISSSDL